MAQANEGDTVRVHYTGTLDDGEQFDSSRGGDPLEFKLGDGNLIGGFEAAVTGMEPGEVRSVRIEAEDGYGPHREELLLEVERERLPEGLEPEVGQPLQMQDGDGNRFVVQVTAVEDASITLDGNHPLAGKDLNFEIELVEIV